MTVTDQIKILDSKIKANQVQYDLSREAAKISTLIERSLGVVWIFDWWRFSTQTKRIWKG